MVEQGGHQKPTVVTPENEAAIKARLSEGSGGSTYDGMPPDMNDRLAKLETGVAKLDASVARLDTSVAVLNSSVDGLRHGQTMILAVIGVAAVVIAGIVGYGITRIDALPGDFLRLNQTLSSAITAARPPPQIVVAPSPPPR